jgi:hypothetical protein
MRFRALIGERSEEFVALAPPMPAAAAATMLETLLAGGARRGPP